MIGARKAIARIGILAALASGGAHAEAIRSFDVDVTLSRSTGIEVEERIRWDFEGVSRHGILRRIPVRYGRGISADYRIGVDVLSVTDGAGGAWPWKESARGSEIEIRIGDPDRLVTGEQTYVLRYRVSRALLWFDDHDELYWNATGNDWTVQVDEARATVRLPEGADPKRVEHACFAGPRGSSLADCSIEQTASEIRFESDAPLAPGSGLTIVVGLPKGVLPEPSQARKWLDRASDFFSPWILLPLGVFGFLFSRWREQGRDPGGVDATPVRYAPPEGLTPAEMGVVIDERADMRDLTSTILDLAVRGHLRIEEVESTRLLFLSNRDYVLHRTGKPTTDLKEHERLLLGALLGSRQQVAASDLQESFYTHVPSIVSALYKEVSGEAAYFPTNPDRVRGNYRIAAVVVAGLAFLVAVADPSLLAVASPLVTALVIFVFGNAMPRRTPKGRRAADEIEGFREFVRRVDADRLERTGGRTADRFEKVLPYALVLGVADPWAQAFAGIYREPPDWYRTRSGRAFRADDFVSDVGRSLSTLGNSMTSRPSSSGGSGSSGFSGGSSGGGFGGGGGSSW
ncbi:hypothetical protein MYXO_01407 [Myxococcaceae bacterium]|nr:hypothetical protein MYXO_01407 [Myxococcaceae bacterium]